MSRRFLLLLTLPIGFIGAACGDTSDVGSPTTPAPTGGTNAGICGTAPASTTAMPSGLRKLDGASNSLSGAGATFPAPVYSLWASEYKKASGVEVAYQSIGSGGGVKQITEATVDFGATDAPLKDSEQAAAKKGPILHIPTVFGAVVPTYNLAGQSSGLVFTGEVLGKIFAGRITTWNDPEVVALNPGASLPAQPIAVVHRSDGSGTTDIWTDYLTKTSPTWVSVLGQGRSQGKEVAWPTGIGGKGNEGVSGAVGQTPGALGYVELTYALEQKLPVGHVKNATGKAIQPCIETVTAAASGTSFPPDLRFSLTNASGPDAYPVTGATWLLVYENQADEAKAKAMVNYLAWTMEQGQVLAPTLKYSPLSPELRTLAISQIRKIKLNGAPLAQAG
ncbi:MAG: phosphate ABC transporter substrate-binding protein PstS [Acidimicrobiales bacterium]